MVNLKNKVALITGASSGIGAGTAVYFASIGCSIAINGRNETKLRKTEQDCIKAGLPSNNVLVVCGDLNIETEAKKVMDKTVEHFGKLDILVNNAGVIRLETPLKTSEADYEWIMDTNVKSVFRMSKLAAPHLKKSKGNIVNVSSTVSERCVPQIGIYSVSKAALDHLTRAIALELGVDGVRVNAVNPGYVVTDLYTGSGLSVEDSTAVFVNAGPKQILGRIGLVEEIAKPIAFLASDDASFMTGATMVVDGGFALKGAP